MSLITFALLAAQASTSSLYAAEIESDSRVEVEDRSVTCDAPPKLGPRAAQPCNVAQWETKIVDEYPRRGMGREESGTVLVEVSVGPDGKIARCVSASLKQTFGLSQIACNKVRQSAKFSPALDELGRAVEGIATFRIEYVLPDWPDNSDVSKEASPYQQHIWAKQISDNFPSINIGRPAWETVVDIRFVVGRSGRVDRCEVVEVTGDKIFGRAACRGIFRYGRYKPALDKAGEPVASVETIRITYRMGQS